jgi:ribosome biogenesis GTPase
VIAANIQVVVVVTDAGPDFNLRRMERYFAIIGRSRAKPVVLVNKADLFSDEQNQAAAEAIRAQNPDADVLITSLKAKRSLKALTDYLKPGISITFIGSSGTGKSSVINHLLGGEYQWTDVVNETTGKGRHTTTARELMVLPGGGIIIDNPGIREVHMWTDEATLRERFADLEELAGQCKFDNCRHGPHAGCAIRSAMAEGKIEASRLDGFLKLEEEIAKLRASRQKRQVTIERRNRRDHRAKSRKYDARRDPDPED